MAKLKFLLFILTILGFFSYTNFVYASNDPISSWSINSATLPHTLANHALVSNSNKLFIIGGATFDDYDDIYSATLNTDNSVSSWTLENHLPATRYGMAKAEKGNKVYILGGLNYNGLAQFTNNVYFSSTHPDGSVDSWQETTALPQAVVEGEAVVVGDRIYFAGGTNSSGRKDQIYKANINPDGTLGSWSQVGTLPVPMVTFGMVSYNNRIYIIGGYAATGGLSDVYSTNVNPADGSLSSWQTQTSLTQPFFDKNQTVLVGNKIIIAGGGALFGSTNKVFYTSINPDGTLASWQQSSSSLPQNIAAGAMTYANGYLYMIGGVGGGGYLNTVYYAKVNAGTQLSVPLLKQTDSAWGGFTYDSANLWAPSNPTIGRWGCVLTSAAMVFQYYGITKLPDGTTPLQPGNLNAWLKGQVDGYVGPGLVNWLALSRLSKQAKAANPSFTTGNALEFSRIGGASKTQLTSDLENNIPGILQEPGHFIVATGIEDTTFKINDPFYNREDLTSYSNTFSSLSRFVPSFTDLSYIMAVVDPAIDLNLKTASGSAVGESFVQEPLQDDESSALSGNPVSMIMLSKPDGGDYTLDVSSLSGKSYSLKFYLYDKDGNVKLASSSGVVGPGDTDTFLISFNKDSSNNSNSKQSVSFKSFIDDINSLCKLGDVNKLMCTALLTQARTAQFTPVKQAVKSMLKAMDLQIKLSKGKTVSNNAYNILHADIQTLLLSL